MAQSNAENISNYKLPGQRGPRDRKVEKAQDSGKALKRLLGYFSKEKKSVVMLFMFVFVTVVCGVLAPKFQSDAIDAIADARYKELPGDLLKMTIVYLFTFAGTYFQGRSSALLSQKTVKDMREELFDHIINLPVSYLDSHPHGDIMSRMTNDVENISTTISQSLSSLFSGVLTVIGTVAMMLWLCPPLTLLSCTTVIFTVVATRLLSAAMRKAYVKRQTLLGGLNGTVEEMVGGYHTVVAYNKEGAIIERFNGVSDELTKIGIRAEVLGGSMGPLMNLINNIGFVIIAAFGGYFAITGRISIGVISAFIIYAKQFGRPIDEIAQVWGQVQTALAGAERVFGLMDVEGEDKSGDISFERGKPVGITFEHVDFSYVEGQRVLKDFNFEVWPGHKVALVGATGSGKTTVVNLLMRFYKPDSGRILIGDVDIQDMDIKSLRDATAIVLQDTVLFADTVRNNLKYSDATVSDAAMYEAARKSHAHGMIGHLKKGYDTMLTANADNISQGQKQLLAIARAFVSGPDILILDEATSNVDTRTEKRIQDAMHRLMKGRTSVVIAHRLSTIKDADVIVVLDGGRIVETGNHEQLLKAGGKYSELYRTQFEGRET